MLSPGFEISFLMVFLHSSIASPVTSLPLGFCCLDEYSVSCMSCHPSWRRLFLLATMLVPQLWAGWLLLSPWFST